MDPVLSYISPLQSPSLQSCKMKPKCKSPIFFFFSLFSLWSRATHSIEAAPKRIFLEAFINIFWYRVSPRDWCWCKATQLLEAAAWYFFSYHTLAGSKYMHSLRILLTECRILVGPGEAAALALHQTLLKDSVESSKAFHGLHNHRNGIQRGEAPTLDENFYCIVCWCPSFTEHFQI